MAASSDDAAAVFPILDAINDTLHGRQMTSRRVTSPIATSSLRCRIVTARDIRCGRGLGRGDVTVTSPRAANGCVVNGNGRQQARDATGDDVSDDAMSLPWHMMSRWCRYAALSNLLALW